MFARVSTLFALFTLFACMLLCAQASPVALPEQDKDLAPRGCYPIYACKLGQVTDATVTATADEPSSTDGSTLENPAEADSEPEPKPVAADSAPESDAAEPAADIAQLSAATSAALPAIALPSVLLAALAGSFAVLL